MSAQSFAPKPADIYREQPMALPDRQPAEQLHHASGVSVVVNGVATAACDAEGASSAKVALLTELDAHQTADRMPQEYFEDAAFKALQQRDSNLKRPAAAVAAISSLTKGQAKIIYKVTWAAGDEKRCRKSFCTLHYRRSETAARRHDVSEEEVKKVRVEAHTNASKLFTEKMRQG